MHKPNDIQRQMISDVITVDSFFSRISPVYSAITSLFVQRFHRSLLNDFFAVCSTISLLIEWFLSFFPYRLMIRTFPLFVSLLLPPLWCLSPPLFHLFLSPSALAVIHTKEQWIWFLKHAIRFLESEILDQSWKIIVNHLSQKSSEQWDLRNPADRTAIFFFSCFLSILSLLSIEKITII